MNRSQREKLLRTRLEDILVEEGILERERLEQAQVEQDRTGKSLGEVLIDREILPDWDLAKLIARHYALPYLDVTAVQPRRDLIDLLTPEFCAQHGILPLDQFGQTMTLAVGAMPNATVLDEIVRRTDLTPFVFVGQARALRNVLAESSKRARSTSAAPAAPAKAAAAAAPVPAAVAPHVPTGFESVGPSEDSALPDLNLPSVSLQLVSGGSSPGMKTPASRPATPARPASSAVPAGGGAGDGLGWMDRAGGGAPHEPPRPKLLPKFAFTQPGGKGAPGAPAPAPAKAATTAAHASAGASGSSTPPKPEAPDKPGGRAWQNIFDQAEETVRRDRKK